jgi:hypothetical protein
VVGGYNLTLLMNVDVKKNEVIVCMWKGNIC